MNSYLNQVCRAIKDLKLEEVKNLCQFIKNSERVWVIGNGGSMSAASHLAEDLLKFRGIPAMAISDASLLTMSANDETLGNMFAYPLKTFADINDLVIGLTMSGNSFNVLNPLVSDDVMCNKFLITGQGGSHYNVNKLVIPSRDIQVCEDITMVIIHLIAKFL